MTKALILRAVRPYSTEEDFLAAEAWSVAARSVLLVDVGPQAEGAVVRIELVLQSGDALIVAEGTVVKHLVATESRPAGLVVKYRRMSADSSEFIKRAIAVCAERSQLSSPFAASLVPRPSVINPPPSLEAQAQGAMATQSSIAPTPRTGQAQGANTNRPTRESGRPSQQPRAQSVSVIPQARRLSTQPPGLPAAAPRSSKQPPPPADAPPVPTSQRSRASDAARSDSKTALGGDAMARLRERSAKKPITVPPDRETILARLKKP